MFAWSRSVCSRLLPNGKLKPKLTERGYIETNDRYETSLPEVFAAGDIIGPPWLAHVASWEAIQAVEGMFGEIGATQSAHLSRAAPTASRRSRALG